LSTEKKIKIAYAYEGLIYLPLFLAYKLKFLPDNVELKYAGGDKEAIKRVIHSEYCSEDEYCDFAICDPFIESDLPEFNKKEHPNEKSKPVTVVGCLIDNPPFWLYKKDNTISNISGLHELLNQDTIKKIWSYKNPNTGYIYAKDLENELKKLGVMMSTIVRLRIFLQRRKKNWKTKVCL